VAQASSLVGCQLNDDTRSGRPSSSRNEDNVVCIRDMISKDRTVTFADALHLQTVCQRHAVTLAPRRVSPYADDTAFIATSRKPTLLVSYQQSYVNDLQRSLDECRIAINISKTTAIYVSRAGRRFIQPRPVTIFRDPIQLIDNTRYLGVNLDKQLTRSNHINQVRMKSAKGWVCWVPSGMGRVVSPSGTECCYISSSFAP
jgi:hypothetical protein